MPVSVNEIATTIWLQIPIMVKMSLGARDQSGKDNVLYFTVGNGRKGLFKFSITLNGGDLYDIELMKFKRKTYEKVVLATAEDVGCESLGRVLLGMEKHLA